MRLIAHLSLALAMLAPLSAAATADDSHASDSTTGQSNTSLQRIYVPDPRMMIANPDDARLTSGAADRGHQLVHPAGPQSEQPSGVVSHNVRPLDRDTPAFAAKHTTTDAS